MDKDTLQLIVWVLSAALTVCMGVIAWTTTGIVGVKVLLAGIDEKLKNIGERLDSIKKESGERLSALEDDVKELQKEFAQIRSELKHIQLRFKESD